MRTFPLYLHVGLPKTATTTLQQDFFSQHPQISYLARRKKRGPPDEDGRFEEFVRWIREEPVLEPELETHRAYINDILDRPLNDKTCWLLSRRDLQVILGLAGKRKHILRVSFFRMQGLF